MASAAAAAAAAFGLGAPGKAESVKTPTTAGGESLYTKASRESEKERGLKAAAVRFNDLAQQKKLDEYINAEQLVCTPLVGLVIAGRAGDGGKFPRFGGERLSLAANVYARAQELFRTEMYGELVWGLQGSAYVHLMDGCPCVPECRDWQCSPLLPEKAEGGRLCPICVAATIVRRALRAHVKFPMVLQLDTFVRFDNEVPGFYYEEAKNLTHLMTVCSAMPPLPAGAPPEQKAVPMMKVKRLLKLNVDRFDVCLTCRERVFRDPAWPRFFKWFPLSPGVDFV